MQFLADIEKFNVKGTIKSGYKTIDANCNACKKKVKAIRPYNDFVCPQCGQKVIPIPGAKESTASTSYFIVPEELKAKLGDKPFSLRVVPAYREMHRTFPSSYTKYASNKMIFCSSKDGVTARRYDRTKGHIESPCSADCPDRLNKTCNLTATFYVVLPDADVFSAYRIIPKSVQSIHNIYATLNRLRNKEGEIVRAICTLELIKRKRKETNTVYYIMQLNPPAVDLATIQKLTGDGSLGIALLGTR
jgi:predicted RNA-binding Zn-ribbon protein involved in translation (DUF1610 family)